jgi:flagellar motility protein MotE (MotC chaperone)
MKKLIGKIIRMLGVVFALHFLVLVILLGAFVFMGYLSKERMSNMAKALKGYRSVTPADYEFLESQRAIKESVHAEARMLVAAREAQKASTGRRDIMYSDMARKLLRLKKEVIEKLDELAGLRKEIAKEREDLAKMKVKEAEDAASPDFLIQMRIYESMTPDSAAKNLYEMEDKDAARYLSQMKKRAAAQVAEAISIFEDALIEEGKLAKENRRLPKITALMKDYNALAKGKPDEE